MLVYLLLLVVTVIPGCKSSRPDHTVPLVNPDQAVKVDTEAGTDEGTIQNIGPPRHLDAGHVESPASTRRRPAETQSFKIPTETNVDDSSTQPVSYQTVQLSLQEVLESVQQCYPEIEAALAEIEAAEGKLLASYGEFDTKFKAFSLSAPLGFYQTYRNKAGVVRPLFNGGEIYGSYKIGSGNFEPWYGERETNDGGEFKAGFDLPFLKDRVIDERRAAVASARAGVTRVEADVNSRLLQLQRAATQSYWDWVATGQVVEIQQQLLALAQQREKQINERVRKGDLARLAQIDNERFIAKRRNSLIKARRSLEKAAIKLSLFYRNEDCSPEVVTSERLPGDFPGSQRISTEEQESDIATAIAVRPELRELQAARRQAKIDLQYANNLLLPKLNAVGFAAQDVGGATETRDKSPFQLELGVLAEVPIQRREASGKIRAAQSKLVQIEAKSRFVTDKIRAEIQDAASAVNAALEQIEQTQQNVALTKQSLELGRQSFEAGDIDLIALNIYETSVADAELQLLDAQFKYFFYQVVYETAKSGQAFNQ